MTDTNNQHIKEEVWSWLHDEQRTVTAKSISLAHAMPRSEAREVLLQLLMEQCQDDDAAAFVFQVFYTHVTFDSLKKCSVIEMKSLDLSREDVSTLSEDDSRVWKFGMYAVALSFKEDYEKSTNGNTDVDVNGLALKLKSAMLADKVAQKECMQQDMNMFSEIQCSAIRPYSEDGKKLIPERRESSDRMVSSNGVTVNGCGSSSSSNKRSASSFNHASKGNELSKRKVTSAAVFFGNASVKKVDVKNKGSKFSSAAKYSSTSSSPKVRSKKAKLDKSEESVEEVHDVSKFTEEKKKNKRVFVDSDSEDEFNEPLSANNTKIQKIKSTNIGNADDFVGDVDEDEDDEREESIRKAKREALEREKEEEKRLKRSEAAKARKKKKQAKAIELEDNNEENEMPQISGAIDNFVSNKVPTQSSNNASGVRKKKRKMVEKTTMDSSGYIHTEMVTEWVDVSDNEEVQKSKQLSLSAGKSKLAAASGKSKAKPSGAKRNGKPLKQMGLMGFFAKKK